MLIVCCDAWQPNASGVSYMYSSRMTDSGEVHQETTLPSPAPLITSTAKRKLRAGVSQFNTNAARRLPLLSLVFCRYYCKTIFLLHQIFLRCPSHSKLGSAFMVL
jgi:hypothetical protein